MLLGMKLAIQSKKRQRNGAGTIRRHEIKSVCPFTGKRRFKDAHQAHDALISARRARQHAESLGIPTARREVRMYECGCGGAHLTSQPVGVLEAVAA